MNIAVITARGGSKRIPGKNIRQFSGKPMIAWPILAAKAAGIFSHIVVSTDSEEIARVAQDWGAICPFMRPAALSDDHTPTAPVFEHALTALAAEGIAAEYACCIYPTAPFLLPEFLQQGLHELETSGAPAAMSVTGFDFPILRALTLDANGGLAFNWPEYELTRSQDLPEFYHDAGQFYWVRVTSFLASKRLVVPGTRPVFLPRKRVQDLDTQEDWEVAELMAKSLLLEGIKQ
ncbi:pseudaminic acid cytidylyltransferase [Desulfovibrio cuneatus]|uniref:pseudaminic acid cytidylyltransferase n=1 Tax=Desulfovibrio cuneatus TaxID=159728 RepID=UPI000413FEB1|nr:pseudaminic acid cytidylyltransferase [Desulfovibrio cuneatus]